MTSTTRKRLLRLLLFGVVVAIVLVIGTPNFIRCRCQSPLAICKSNLKNIGLGLEMYSVDHGTYPRELKDLTPVYLKVLPTCPSGKSYDADIVGEEYLVFCAGGWHGKGRLSEAHSSKSHKQVKTAPGSPAYSSTQGILTDKILFTLDGLDRKSEAYLTACRNVLASTLAIVALLVIWGALRRRYISRRRSSQYEGSASRVLDSET